PAPVLEPERPSSPAEERKRFTRTLVDGAGAASRASVPPPVPEEARRHASTLAGHSPPPPPFSPPGQGASVLSPPKWRGAKAYLEGREPKPRVSSIPNMPAVSPAAAAAHASAIPSKVTTKLGNPPARSPQDEAPVGAASAAAAAGGDEAVERTLDGQPPVPQLNGKRADS